MGRSPADIVASLQETFGDAPPTEELARTREFTFIAENWRKR